MNILTVAAITPRKRINLCRDTCREMVKRGYEVNWRVIGDGPLRKTVMINAPVQMEWIRRVNDLTKDFSWADVFVLPSLDEGLGMVYVESVANLTPFVCMSGQGGDEVIRLSRGAGISIDDSWSYPIIVSRLIEAIDYASCLRVSTEQREAILGEFSPTKIKGGWAKLGVTI